MKYNLGMDNVTHRKKQFVGVPFYAFITFLMGGLGITGVLALWRDHHYGFAIVTGLLVFTHIGLYWLNLKETSSVHWWTFYYVAQTALIIAPTMLIYGSTRDIGLSFLSSGIISIIGESLGVWGNTRRALTLGLFYLSVLIGSFFVLGDRALMSVYLSEMLINGGFVVLLMVVFNQQLKERQRAEDLAERLESMNAKLAAYAVRNERLTLQAERERIARELHDTLAQGVAGLVLQLEAIKAHQKQDNHAQATNITEQALERARNTLKESRAAIEDLRSEDADFCRTIERVLGEFQGVGQTRFALNIQLDAKKPLPQHVQHHARRVLHEILTNIQKHAHADDAKILIVQAGDSLKLSVQDNGIGFDAQNIPLQGHFGLQGLQERAQLTNGQYTLASTPGEGTRIDFIFPLGES